MERLRIVNSTVGVISYQLTRKRVKNWNLRVREERVFLSVPLWVSVEQADAFIQSRGAWIARALERQSKTAKVRLEELPREVCMERLAAALERIYPLVERFGVTYPQLRLRRMRSQWGNCHYKSNYITLNTALASCPEKLQDYVCLHELVHFLHPDHGLGFYTVMDNLMPDWKERRGMLKNYQLQ